MIGTRVGYQAVSNSPSPVLSAITADGVNTVTCSDLSKIVVGSNVDIVNASTGAVLASNRQITNVTSAGVVTYNGADVTAIAGTHVVVPTGGVPPTSRSNLNGGPSDRFGFSLGSAGVTIGDTIARLTGGPNSAYWTAARIASHTD